MTAHSLLFASLCAVFVIGLYAVISFCAVEEWYPQKYTWLNAAGSLLLLLSFLHKTLFSDTWRKYHSVSTKGADGKEVIFLVRNSLLCHPAGQFASCPRDNPCTRMTIMRSTGFWRNEHGGFCQQTKRRSAGRAAPDRCNGRREGATLLRRANTVKNRSSKY